MGWIRKSFSTAGYVDVEQRTDPTFSVGDAGLAEFLGLSNNTTAGVTVNVNSALGLSAVWRAISLIAGVIAALPLKSYKRDGDRKERVQTWLDDPGGPVGMDRFSWVETVVAHLLLHGNAYLAHVYTGAGSLAGLTPISPSSVSVEPDDEFGKHFKVQMRDGTVRELTPLDVCHIVGLSTDGLKGLSPISVARKSLGVAIAGDEAAGRMYANGLLLGGILVPKDGSLTTEQLDQIKAGFKARAQGLRNAGDIALLNAEVSFEPWSMSAEDAQFLESRRFSVTEVARWFGLPKHLLAEDGASMWGAGIAEMNRGLSAYTLSLYTARIESRLSRLLSRPTFCEFDLSGLLQPSPEDEIRLLIEQVQAGLLTVDEARGIRNMPPLAAPALEVVE